MKKKFWIIASIYGTAILLILCGSFFDEQIDQFLFNQENAAAKIAAAYGQSPAYWLFLSSVFTGWCLLPKQWNLKKTAWSVLDIICIAGIWIYAQHAAYKIYPHSFLWILTAAIVFLPPCFITYFLYPMKPADRRYFVYFGATIFGLQIISIEALKLIWGRPRFWVLETYPEVPFENWWNLSSTARNLYMQPLGIPADGFKSFPSGHTASACCLFALCQAARLKNKTPIVYLLLLLLAAVGTIFTAAGRMILGMHFLSDVTTGFLITFSFTILAYHLFFERRKEIRNNV